MNIKDLLEIAEDTKCDVGIEIMHRNENICVILSLTLDGHSVIVNLPSDDVKDDTNNLVETNFDHMITCFRGK